MFLLPFIQLLICSSGFVLLVYLSPCVVATSYIATTQLMVLCPCSTPQDCTVFNHILVLVDSFNIVDRSTHFSGQAWDIFLSALHLLLVGDNPAQGLVPLQMLSSDGFTEFFELVLSFAEQGDATCSHIRLSLSFLLENVRTLCACHLFLPLLMCTFSAV